MDETGYIVVFTTAGSLEEAEEISEVLIKERLAACIQIIGKIRSIYIWKENIERDEEYLCIIKTRENLYNDLEGRIKELHSYEVPEIVKLGITGGSRDYLSWLGTVVRDLRS